MYRQKLVRQVSGAVRPIADTASQYITADKPEVTATFTSQEVNTGFPTGNTETATAHTGSQPGLISSADRSATSSDISNAETSMPTLSYYGDVPISGSASHARALPYGVCAVVCVGAGRACFNRGRCC